MTGYTLTNGACLVNPCPSGQYRRYGICLVNPVGCTTFDYFTNCTVCAATYLLTNGTCVRIPLKCPDRTYYNVEDYVCSPVSDRCDTFNSSTGLCLTCLAMTDIVVDGVCIETVDPGCTDRQYVMNGLCFDIEALCGTF